MKADLLLLCPAIVAFGTLGLARTDSTFPRTQKPASTTMPERSPLSKIDQLLGLDVKNAEGEEVAEIHDLILDASDGSIDYVILERGGILGVGESKSTVPWDRIRFASQTVGNADGDLFATTTLTEEQIKNAPEYKKDEHLEGKLQRRDEPYAKADYKQAADEQMRVTWTCARELKGANIKNMADDDLGEIEEIVLDMHDGFVAYTVLSAGGVLGLGEKHYALPWQVTEFSRNDDKDLVVRSKLTKTQLSKAPEYDAKNWNKMRSSSWVDEISRYYAVDPYFSGTTPASAHKNPEGKPKD